MVRLFLIKNSNSDFLRGHHTLTQDERVLAKQGENHFIRDEYALNCHMGVWDEGISRDLESRANTVNVNRTNSCFFFPYQKRMLFGAAKELQKRAYDNSQLKRSNLYTRVGLWLATIALLVSAWVGVMRLGIA